MQLNPNGAGGHTQVSDGWIIQVTNSLPNNSPARKAIENARENNKLKTAITGVDRQTGKAVILPVEVPSKTTIKRK